MFGFSTDKGIKTVLKIPDMACSMCEAHINDAVRKVFDVIKVKSSHKKGETVIISKEPIPEEELRNVIESTGYTVESIERRLP